MKTIRNKTDGVAKRFANHIAEQLVANEPEKYEYCPKHVYRGQECVRNGIATALNTKVVVTEVKDDTES